MGTTEFGTPEKPNLEALSRYLSLCLAQWENRIGQGIRLGNVSGPLDDSARQRHPISVFQKLTKPLYLTPEKPNTARSEVPVFMGGQEVGTLYNILFYPGDGTGANTNYSLNDVIVPDRLKFDEKPERVIPRVKSCAFEIAIPYVSIPTKGNFVIENRVLLEELSLADDITTIINLAFLGTTPLEYTQLCNNMGIGDTKPAIQLTTGYFTDGTRFGSPHAIFQDPMVDAMQMVGFLAVDKADSLLAKTLRRLPLKPFVYA